MTRYLATIVFLLVYTLASAAQTNPPPAHQHNVTAVVDGATNPDQIPDAVAYRLYFVSVSENPTPSADEAKRQHAHLGKARLSETDIQAASKVLANFKLAYAALIDTYNHSPEVLNNTNDGLSLFLAKRDALVQETRDALKAVLTQDGMGAFDTNVKREKTHMKVAAQEVGQ